MNKKILLIVLVIILAISGVIYYIYNYSKHTEPVSPSLIQAWVEEIKNRVENTTYQIGKDLVTLKNGISETQLPNSSAIVKTKIFGEPVFGDLDGNGDDDAGLILTYESGGSGTFYYAASAINYNGDFQGTNAILLGDRIAPQNIEIREGILIANYAERKPNEPMTTQPSIGVSKYIRFENGILKEISKPENL
jgi:hypothetical protein